MKNFFNKKSIILGSVLIIVIILIIILSLIIYNVYFNVFLKQESSKLTPIILAEENQNYDYNVYFYGITDIQITYNNEKVSLKESLKSNKIHMDDIVHMALEDFKNGVITALGLQDGGSTEYIYPDYKIIKLNKIKDASSEYKGERDVYITNTDIDLTDIYNINNW